jgi:hypothetical protein
VAFLSSALQLLEQLRIFTGFLTPQKATEVLFDFLNYIVWRPPCQASAQALIILISGVPIFDQPFWNEAESRRSGP